MQLRYIIIKVWDLKRAKAFYEKFLGITPYKEEAKRMVVFNLGNIKIGLYNPLADGDTLSQEDFGTSCRAAFGTDDLDGERDRVSQFAQITSHHQVDTHERFEFKDTEGNMLEIHKI